MRTRSAWEQTVKEELRVLEQSSSAAGQKLQVRLQKYTKTMLKYSQFKTAEDENQRPEREPKRLKVEPQQFRMLQKTRISAVRGSPND